MTVGGGVVAFNQVGEQVEEDLRRAEMLAAPILLLFSLLVFRSLVAALLPLAVGMTTILITFSLLRLVNAVEPMSTFAINLITGLGLGLAIDYSLFMVSRFREELATGAGRAEALRAHDAHRRAAPCCSPPSPWPRRSRRCSCSRCASCTRWASAACWCALTAAFVSLTLLPALLAVARPARQRAQPQALAGRHAPRRRPRAAGPVVPALAPVMRRPAPIAIATAALLIVLGLPFLRIEFTGVDASVLPQERSARVVDDAIRTEFPPGPTSPVTVVAGVGERGRAAAERLRARARRRSTGAARVSAPEQAGGYWLIDVVPERAALSDSRQGAGARRARARRRRSRSRSAARPPRSSTSRPRSATRCRSRWRSSPRRRWSSCS